MLSPQEFKILSLQVRTDRALWYVVKMLCMKGTGIGSLHPRYTCPYCDRKRTFSIRLGHGWWQCFKCGKSGDATQLLVDHGPFQSKLEAMIFLKLHS